MPKMGSDLESDSCERTVSGVPPRKFSTARATHTFDLISTALSCETASAHR